MSEKKYCTCDDNETQKLRDFRWCKGCNKPVKPINFLYSTEVDFLLTLIDLPGLIRLRRVCELIRGEWNKEQKSGKPFYEEFYSDTRMSLASISHLQTLIEVEEMKRRKNE